MRMRSFMDADYIAKQYKEMHKKGIFSGASLRPHIKDIKGLVDKHEVKSLLDYGCGGASVHMTERLAEQVGLYDPYREYYSKRPQRKFDMVICTDVMEHVPEDNVDEVLTDIDNYALKVVFFSIALYPAKKTFENGANLHVTLKPKEWWKTKIAKNINDKVSVIHFEER